MEDIRQSRLVMAIHVGSQGTTAEVKAWLERRKPARTVDTGNGTYDGALDQL